MHGEMVSMLSRLPLCMKKHGGVYLTEGCLQAGHLDLHSGGYTNYFAGCQQWFHHTVVTGSVHSYRWGAEGSHPGQGRCTASAGTATFAGSGNLLHKGTETPSSTASRAAAWLPLCSATGLQPKLALGSSLNPAYLMEAIHVDLCRLKEKRSSFPAVKIQSHR